MEILWPHFTTIDVFDPDNILIRRNLHIPPAGLLRVKICNAMNLRKADRFSESDPYVTVIYHEGDGISAKTKTIFNNPNPIWNQTFDFVLMNNAKRFLSFICKDFDNVGTHDLLGKADITTDSLLDAPNSIIARQFDFTYHVCTFCLRNHQ